MSQLTFSQPNIHQIDCFIDGVWCALIQWLGPNWASVSDQGDNWDLSVVEIVGREIDLSAGTFFGDGRYFFGGTLAEAKEALCYHLNIE